MKFGWVVLGLTVAPIIFVSAKPPMVTFASQATAQPSNAISVVGNRRVATQTILAYFRTNADGQFNDAVLDDGLSDLIGSGLFLDAGISHRGGRIIITVIENSEVDSNSRPSPAETHLI